MYFNDNLLFIFFSFERKSLCSNITKDFDTGVSSGHQMLVLTWPTVEDLGISILLSNGTKAKLNFRCLVFSGYDFKPEE